MKLTRERKILLVVLAVGVAILVMDHLSGPRGSEAAEVAIPATDSHPTERVALSAPGTAVPRASLAARLRTVAAEGDTAHSAFQVPAQWIAASGQITASTTPGSRKDPGALFSAQHRLDGLLISDRRREAIINGHNVAVGQTIDGFQLVGIENSQAILEAGSHRITLKMTTPAAIGPSPAILPDVPGPAR